MSDWWLPFLAGVGTALVVMIICAVMLYRVWMGYVLKTAVPTFVHGFSDAFQGELATIMEQMEP